LKDLLTDRDVTPLQAVISLKFVSDQINLSDVALRDISG
jgi:hypothetical protein